MARTSSKSALCDVQEFDTWLSLAAHDIAVSGIWKLLIAVVSIVWVVGTKSTSPTSNPETTASPFVLRRCSCIPAPQVLSIHKSTNSDR